MTGKREFWTVPFAPLRYLVAWLLYAAMRAAVLLPFRWQLKIGKGAGSLARRLLKRRREIVDTNLELCFPDLEPARRERLAREHFRSLGASVVEMSMGWFGSIETIEKLVEIEGAEHLRRALEAGRGVVLYSGHFTGFEFVFPVVKRLCPRLCGMYKTQRNPLMNRIMTKGRSRSFDHLFSKESVRSLIKELNRNSVVWYAPDQRYASKGGKLVPFFGVPAMTNTAISRIARLSGATVLPYFSRRLPGDTKYLVSILPPLRDFPTDDEVRDAERLIAQLEEFVRECPEQYWWVHQRFKGRPASFGDVYATASH